MRALSFVLLLVVAQTAGAIDIADEFADPADEAMYRSITDEVRCLVCQNQTIANSTAPLAADLRREIRRMIEAGQSEAEIKDFLVERYGNFILYKPRFQSWNLLLWLGPAALVLAGLIALIFNVKRRAALPIDEDAP